jgi:hypothetical protein
MEIFGHSSISLTMNTYSHVIPVMLEEVAAKMDDILTEPAQPIETAAGKTDSDAVATASISGSVQ